MKKITASIEALLIYSNILIKTNPSTSMLALWEKEGRVGVTGLEIADVSKDGVTGLDGTGELSERVTDFLSEDELVLLCLLTLSLCSRSKDNSSE